MKEKEINVVNFQCPRWGHVFSVDSQKKMLVTAHGWYSSSRYGNTSLKKGAIVVKRGQNGGYWFGRVKSIEWANDPQDMFFCKCKTIVKDRQLSKAEYKYIQKTYF